MGESIRETMYRVASGQIEDPSIEITTDEGDTMKFTGQAAKHFAVGFLLGRRSKVDDMLIEINTPEKAEG